MYINYLTLGIIIIVFIGIGIIIGKSLNKPATINSISQEDLKNYLEHYIRQLGDYINKNSTAQNSKITEVNTILKTLFDNYSNDRIDSSNVLKNIDKITNDMNRLFSNSKEFGTISENLLNNLLSLSYIEDVNYFQQFSIKEDSKEKVDFAILIPTKNNKIYLPIDSKFPKDTYLNYIEDQTKENLSQFKSTIKSFAKDINSKYIIENKTTNFAIMYIPTDNILQVCFKDNLYFDIFKEYKVIICTPTTIIPIIEILREFYSQYELENQIKSITNNLKTIDKSSNSIKEDVSYIVKKLDNISKNADKIGKCKIEDDSEENTKN